MNTKILSLIIFIATYIFFIILPGKRTSVALASVAFLLSAGAISFKEAFFAINWNVMGIFVGTLIIADLFMDSGMPAYIAERIVNSSRNTAQAILSICILTGFISAVVENVATVLIIAPIALSLAKKLNINPVNMIISIAISSNLQGVATLVGDPPSMLLAGFAKMNFWDFFIYHGKPGIFFAVELGAIASIFVLFYIFKKHKEKISLVSVEKIKSLIPTVILVLLVVSLALSSFLSEGFSYAGAICMVLGFLGLIWDKIFNKSLLTKRIIVLDWETTLFLMGVFIIVGSLTVNGWIDAIALNLSNLIGGNLFLGYTVIVFASVFLSAFVDNVPFLAAMLPVAISMSGSLGVPPQLFLFGLLIGASLGGNITPFGASANIVACGLLKKEGYEIKFMDFVRIGLPFTLVAVGAAYLFLWKVWGRF
ncbi:MAG: hypothetical protein COY53_00025 [Elusimicrobia bacterium CG_4_10_14_0_8_um_filter_37_32]|nr:MAG: hypothetical protein COY53_00025 [Elusimicrobia bacterium CG_4_10_14_0_8_um_filter_37_32]